MKIIHTTQVVNITSRMHETMSIIYKNEKNNKIFSDSTQTSATQYIGMWLVSSRLTLLTGLYLRGWTMGEEGQGVDCTVLLLQQVKLEGTSLCGGLLKGIPGDCAKS